MKKRNLSHHRKLAKSIVPKEILNKIKKVKDKDDRLSLYKYSTKSYLEVRQAKIEMLLKKHSEKHNLFEAYVKSKLLNIKLKYFQLTNKKKDLKEAVRLIKEIESELKVLR